MRFHGSHLLMIKKGFLLLFGLCYQFSRSQIIHIQRLPLYIEKVSPAKQ
jgi:hypothetical protein